MTKPFSAACLAALLGLPLVAPAAGMQKANVPPSLDLHYSLRAQQQGLTLKGDAQITWRNAGNRYSMSNQIRAMLLGKILEEGSEGAIDASGLLPEVYTQKRYRKPPAQASFDRGRGRINFAGVEQSAPLKGGEQDRGSAIWQLISLARAAPASFKPGASWTFAVAGPHDVDPWTFQVVGQESLDTAQGRQATVHVRKAPPPEHGGQQIDFWLAPALDWIPVRLLYREPDGDTIEQTLERIARK